MRKAYIGELEEVILLTVAILQDNAYGVAIGLHLQQDLNRKLSISAIHATLDRLSKKGFVTSHMGGATAERGGRRKRYFKVTAAGSRVLTEIQEVRAQLWSQIPPNALAAI
ncbi:PadR family transcriptional regulator [Reichenbachiella ulvae]|uniref:PadR family transcriptional regulator n=1 Tax=Reichenbachiella ulvae TaxID=2980104 RepID=A0ABT3CQH5_9BACT|nr:PadR family transcriptional regulator [Reichenbachiella ulvae]MCV9385956.1 PadR family transcriptional regulator [Reichenbachiella ulvae]